MRTSGYSWFTGKLSEDPRTTDTIVLTLPGYLSLLAEMRRDVSTLESIAAELEAVTVVTLYYQRGGEDLPDYRAQTLTSGWDTEFMRIFARYNNFARIWNNHSFRVLGYVPVKVGEGKTEGPETDVYMQKITKLIEFCMGCVNGLREYDYPLAELSENDPELADEEIAASLHAGANNKNAPADPLQARERIESAIKRIVAIESENPSKPDLYPLNSDKEGFETPEVDQAWTQAHGSDMVNAVKNSTDWSLNNFLVTFIEAKEPSLQEYRFSPYAESRLLSAALCSVMDSVDKAGMTEIVRSGMTYMAK